MGVPDTVAVSPRRVNSRTSPERDTGSTDGVAAEGENANPKLTSTFTVASYDASRPLTVAGSGCSASTADTAMVKVPVALAVVVVTSTA